MIHYLIINASKLRLVNVNSTASTIAWESILRCRQEKTFRASLKYQISNASKSYCRSANIKNRNFECSVTKFLSTFNVNIKFKLSMFFLRHQINVYILTRSVQSCASAACTSLSSWKCEGSSQKGFELRPSNFQTSVLPKFNKTAAFLSSFYYFLYLREVDPTPYIITSPNFSD